jgi:hypothetical protein
MSDLKGKRDRSPAFPQIPLGEVVERLTAFEKCFGRHPAPLDKAGLAWNVKQSGEVLAAMRHFGFVEYAGGADARQVAITEDGRNLLRAQQPSIRQEILRSAAIRPKEINRFWGIWGSDRPPDPVCIDELVLRNGFSDRGAPIFLRSYDKTIAFAGLSETDRIAFDSIEAERGRDDVVSEESPPLKPLGLTPPPPRGAVLMDGERELTTGLLSRDANFRLIVTGRVGVREIERLIKKLELDKEILADETEEAEATD